MSKAYPDSEFELVAYGGAYAMLVESTSTVMEGISAITKMDNVTVVVCEAALDKHGKKKTDLIPGVGSVPDGIYELILKQQAGWGYIKEMK
jgi:intracellular sulfur oxidation DsrE/DsrF family protein